MSEQELLHGLDRRARAAVAALDRVLGDEPAPPFVPDARTGSSRRRWTPLLVAAGLLVVALVGAVVAFDAAGEESGTIAGEGELVDPGTRVVLADPAAVGFDLHGAVVAPDDDAVPSPMGPIDVQVPNRSGDGWSAAVVTSTGEYNDGAFTGEVVDIGALLAVLEWDGPGSRSIRWGDGQTMHQIATSTLSDDDLVALASDAVEAGWAGGPLPDHRVVHTGPFTDVSPSLWTPSGGLVAYRHDGGLDFVISTGPGSEARWRASHVLAATAEERRFDGRDVVVATFRPHASVRVASWLEPDGALVQVQTYGDIDRLLDLVDGHLERLDRAGFAQLAFDQPLPEDETPLPFPSEQIQTWSMSSEHPFEPPPGGRIVALLEHAAGDRTYRVGLVEDGDGGLRLQTRSIDDASGSGSGSEAPIHDLTAPRLSSSSSGFTNTSGAAFVSERSVSGLLPAGSRILSITDLASGDPITITGSDGKPVPGSDLQLVVAVLETPDAAVDRQETSSGPVDVEVLLTDGTTTIYRL